MKRFALALIAILIVGGTAPVDGYIARKSVVGNAALNQRWASSTVSWSLVAAPGSRVTGSRSLAAVAQASFDAWDVVTTADITLVRGSDSTASIGYDQVNIVKTNMTTPEYSNAGGSTALALTLTSVALLTGEILDSDIIFNPDIDFSTDPTTPSGSYDLESVLTHEVGHLLGLEHSAVLSSTMFPRISKGNSGLRVLSADDVAGVSSIYPSTTYLARGSLSGTVRLTSNAVVYGAIVVAVNSSGQPVAQGLTDIRGNYRIDGLEAGTYRIYAEPMDSPFDFGDQDVLQTLYPGVTNNSGFTTRFR